MIVRDPVERIGGTPRAQARYQQADERVSLMYILDHESSDRARLSAESPFGGQLSEVAERVLDFVTKWGRNASPFKIATVYLKLNWKGIQFWRDVSKAAAAGHELLARIEGLEGVTAADLDYVERYFNTAAMIANDAMDARAELDRAISGWDGALAQANRTRDFTRKAAWEAITLLDMRFNNEGGTFRAYLVNARDKAARTESWARRKQYHGAHILGKWTPEWYKPPTPD